MTDPNSPHSQEREGAPFRLWPALAGNVRRFPPVLQFLTRSTPHLEHELRAATLATFRRGGQIEQICNEIHRVALENHFRATIGVQEVSSRNMPSFEGLTVLSAILIIDLQFDPELGISAPS